MSEVTSETRKRSKKRHREDDSKENEKRSKKKHRKGRAEEDKTENGVMDDVPVVSAADVAKLVENSEEIEKEHKKKKKKKDKDKHKHKDNQESQDVIEPSNETNGDADAAGATTEPEAEKKTEKKDKHKHKHKHKNKHRDENHDEIEENEINVNDNANPQNLQTLIDLGGSSSEDILRAFQQLDLAHLQGVLGVLDLPSMGVHLDITPGESTTSNKPTVKKTFKKQSTTTADAEPSKKVKRKHVVDLKNLVDPNADRPQAVMLATKWLSSKELSELEVSSGLVFKKGKFSFTEDHALKTAIEQYRARSALSEEQMLTFITAKRTPEHKRFWTDVALAVPGRPVQAVYHRVKRIYNPQGNQGKWIPEEDAALRRAVADLGFAWTKVSEHIGRTPADCRDRWRNHVGLSHKQFGKWSLEEEEELTNIVRSYTVEKGKELDSEILWKAVSDKMEGRRSREQCRNKWRDDLQVKAMIKDGRRRWSQHDNHILIHQMSTLSVNDDSEIVWKDLMANENLKSSSTHNLQRRWKRLEESVPNYENMAYKDILNVLLDRYAQKPSGSPAAASKKPENEKKERKKKKFPQPPEPKSAEVIEDSDENNTDGDVHTGNDEEQEDQQDSDGQSSDDERGDIESSLKPTLENESESEEDAEEDSD